MYDIYEYDTCYGFTYTDLDPRFSARSVVTDGNKTHLAHTHTSPCYHVTIVQYHCYHDSSLTTLVDPTQHSRHTSP